MSSRFKAARFRALLLAAATALLVAAPPALAATSGKYIGGVEDGEKVQLRGFDHKTSTQLLGLELDNGTLLETYCVELDVTARHGAQMIESPWSAYPDQAEIFAAKPDKVLWILHHSYPNVEVDELGQTVGVELSQAEAIAGTQAAIWHFSNDAELADEGNGADVVALYDYLTGEANTGIGEQPPVSLSLTPELIDDVEAGTNAGPFTLDTTADSVELTVEGPEGVQIVDGSGQPIAPVSPMDKDIFSVTEFWLSPPADGAAGEATVHAEGEATVEKGRLFVGADNEANPTQTLIVATSTKTKASAEAAARWLEAPTSSPTTTPTETTPPTETTTTTSETTAPPSTTTPPPSSDLPVTGASVLPVLGLGLLLIAAGVGALVLQRRLRRSA
jgi:TQXA domain-containing protein